MAAKVVTQSGCKRRSVLVVDDHWFARHALRELLNGQPDLRMCGEEVPAREAPEAIRRLGPDLVSLDIQMPKENGLRVLKKMRAIRPDIPVLIFSFLAEPHYVERALKAGARGYVSKWDPPEKLIHGMREALAGRLYLSEDLAMPLVVKATRKARVVRRQAWGVANLTDRELEVFRLLGKGRNTREIVTQMGVGIKTFETYKQRIKRKFNLTNSSQIVHAATLYVSTEGNE